MKRKRFLFVLVVSVGALLSLAAAVAAMPGSQESQPGGAGVYRGVSTAVKFDVSPPLRTIQPVEMKPGAAKEIPELPSGLEGLLGPQDIDPVVQDKVGAPLISAPSISFDGPSNLSNVSPPDPVGDVGPNHYVAMSNLSFQIFNKSGASLYGPALNNTLWAGFGGACQTENAGDPIVIYDQLDDRWILSQFTAAGPTFYNCVAVSTSGDPTGSYYRYAFSTGGNFPDYPKYGMWSDALYISTREFLGAGGAFQGMGAYAVNRAQLIAGNPTPQVISFLATAASAGGAYNIGDGLLPTDLDGNILPPAGRPNFFVGTMDNGGPYGAPQDALMLWKFTADFATPANSTFTLASTIPVAAFDSIFPCTPLARDCIPQPGTAAKIDILSYRQRPMWRLAYRNFGTHESLVTNQSVEASAGIAGIRWWEIRSPNSSPVIYQEGTYAPGVSDTIHRWMGSIAMDSAGNMALGYSASNGTSTYPSVWYTGRLSSSALGTMPLGEGSIITGTGSQTGSQRWGDYTSMNVDPVDDCTFWYVNQYLPTTSSVGWRLRIGAFRYNECGSPDFTIGAAPLSAAICAPVSATYTVTVGSVYSFANPVTLSVPVPPTNTTASFSVNPVTPVGSSVLTIGNTGAATAGSYSIDVIGVSATRTHTTTVGLGLFTAAPGVPTLAAPANGANGVNTQPIFTWVAGSQAYSYTLEIATDVGFTNIVHTVTGLSGTSYAGALLNSNTVYYWRVRPANVCGVGVTSTVFSFRTQAAPGDCSIGTTPNVLYSTDFDTGAAGWTHNAITGTDTWVLTSTNTHSGSAAWYAANLATVSDQRLTSPAVALPAGQNPVVLKFWNWQHMETRTGGCFDGGILEVSNNGGASWTQVVSPSLLTDPYDGPISASFSNPLANLNAWCGNNPQPYLNSIVDVSAYAGQTVQFRFRLGTDTSVGRPGWYIDDVAVRSCQAAALPSFTSVNVTPGAINENNVITLTGTFTNPNPPGAHTLTVNWGGGMTGTLPTLGAGVYAFTATHQYLDDNPTGTPSDLNSINLTLSDSMAGSAFTTTNVTVSNVAPVVNAGPDRAAPANTAIQLAGGFTDLGTLDTHIIAWNFGDGSALASTLAPWHTYTQTGIYTATLTVTDDDTGTDIDFLLINVTPVKVYLPLVLKAN